MTYSTKEEILAEYRKCPDMDPPMTMMRLEEIIRDRVMQNAGRYIVFAFIGLKGERFDRHYEIKREDVPPELLE